MFFRDQYSFVVEGGEVVGSKIVTQVVGSKMPQYRLFGDTVDVAGMMTITGEGELALW